MLTRAEETKLRKELAEAEAEAKRASEALKKANEKKKAKKAEAKKEGLSDRKPSRFAVASFVLASEFLAAPRTEAEIDKESLRVAVANGLKSNENETATVRKAVLKVLFANGSLRVVDGKIARTEEAKKATA